MTPEQVAEGIGNVCRQTALATMNDIHATYPSLSRGDLVVAWREVWRAIEAKVRTLTAALPDDAVVDWDAMVADIASTRQEYLTALPDAPHARLSGPVAHPRDRLN